MWRSHYYVCSRHIMRLQIQSPVKSRHPQLSLWQYMLVSTSSLLRSLCLSNGTKVQWAAVHAKRAQKRTSRTLKIALIATPTMKTRRNTLCRLGWRLVSKIARSMRPNPPMKEPRMANDESTCSRLRMVGINLCHYPWIFGRKTSHTHGAPSGMSQPPFDNKRQEKWHCRDRCSSDE